MTTKFKFCPSCDKIITAFYEALNIVDLEEDFVCSLLETAGNNDDLGELPFDKIGCQISRFVLRRRIIVHYYLGTPKPNNADSALINGLLANIQEHARTVLADRGVINLDDYRVKRRK